MKDMYKQKWFWVVALFAAINIIGLIKIGLLVEGRSGVNPFEIIGHKIAGLVSPLFQHGKQVVEDAVNEVTFNVRSMEASASQGKASVHLELTQTVDQAAIKGYIEVDPPVKFQMEAQYSTIYLYGDFQPGQKYEITALKGLPSTEGGKLLWDRTEEVIIPDFEPFAYFKAPGMYMSLKGNQTIPVESINVDKLQFTVHKVYDNNVVYLLNNKGGKEIPSDLGMDVFEKEVPLIVQANKTMLSSLTLKDILPEGSKGLYFIAINDERGTWDDQRDAKLVLTTDIGIVVKQGTSEMLVWLNSLADTTSVAGASVKVFTKANQMILEGKTDENGLVRFNDVKFSDKNKPFVVTASKDDDLSFLELEPNVISETDFDVQGRPYLSAGYEAFIYSERGIYRPGERAHLRAIVRGAGVEIPESFPLSIQIVRPDGQNFKKVTGVLSTFGTVDFDLDIPNYALTGSYVAQALVPGSDDPIGTMKFNVEEFVPDSLKVTVKTPQESYRLGDVIPLSVTVLESFGAPAVGRNIEFAYKFKAVNFEPKAFKGYSFTDETIKYEPKTVKVGIKASDALGQAMIDVTLPKELKVPSSIEVEIKTVVKEVGGRGVTNYLEKTVVPYSFFIGVRQSKEGFGMVSEPVSFDYVFLSPDEEVFTPGAVKVQVAKIIWNSFLKRNQAGNMEYVTESREEIVKEEAVTTSLPQGSYAFTPGTWGDYIVRISGTEPNSHTTAVKFYVSGPDASQPWAMERPDRIELVPDKQKYTVDETAKLIVKSPFKGRALLSCSTDKVIYTQPMDLLELTQEVQIPITEEFQPNAYCSVTAIRPVAFEEHWSSHRGFGIVPIMTDQGGKELKVTVNAPEKVSPGDKLTLQVNAEISLEPVELSVAVVDDAVLRLTAFKTPDPFAFFYGKRSNGVLTADVYSLLMPEFAKAMITPASSPSGDASYANHYNPVSAKRVKPTALWQSSIVTDAQGKATVEFTVPDFTGTLKYMVIAAGKKDFGRSDGAIRSIQPIMLTPTLPRFLAMNDRFTVTTIVHNMTGQDGKIDVSLATSTGLEILGNKSVSVEVKNEGESVVTFDLQAPGLPQKAEMKFIAVMGDKRAERSFEIAVRPPVPWTTVGGTGEVKENTTATFKIPGDWVPGSGKYQFSINAMPALKFTGGLKFLLDYPHGCIEQTTSAVFPLLYLKPLAAKLDPKRYTSDAVDALVNAGIDRVLAMQTFSGGFGWWPGSSNVFDWGSVYAMDFLVEADKAGYAVPFLAKTAGLNFLEVMLSGSKGASDMETDSQFEDQTKAYAVYVLAKAGRIKGSWIRKLQESSNNLDQGARSHIVGALVLMGDRKAADGILTKGVKDDRIDNQQGATLNSYVREQAVSLSVYMDVEPESAFVPVLVKRLDDALSAGRWATTQENGVALIALGKYAKFISGQDIAYEGVLSVEGKEIARFDNKGGFDLKDMDLGGKQISVSINGKGSAYYFWSVDAVPVLDKVEEKDAGITVRRSYLDKEGKPADLTKVKQGDVLVADITVDPRGEVKNLVIEDLLPAGFEIENPRIKTSESLDWVHKDVFKVDHMDIRDDRLVLFADLNGKGHYRYIVRAVSKGEFVLPAVRGELMYRPSVFSVSGQGKVKVE